jgi:DNA mismatch endonuclease, patch repair protein
MNKQVKQRSYNMSRIKSSGSKIENIMGKALWSNGYRYRKQYVGLPGRPDFVLVKHKIAIFCDSAFWHGYKNMSTMLHNFKSNREFWIPKIRSNIKRDKHVNRKLKKLGWRVLRFWDFEIEKDVKKCVEKVQENVEK